MVWSQFCGKPRLYLVTEEAQGQSQSKSEGETQKERRKDGLGRVVGEVYPTKKKLEELIDKQLRKGELNMFNQRQMIKWQSTSSVKQKATGKRLAYISGN